MRARQDGTATWLRLLGTVLMTLLLVLVTAVDLDGDPLTTNIPDAVLTERTPLPKLGERKRDDAGGDVQVTARAVRRVVQVVRRARGWTLPLRRFPRSILTDVPI